jgi:hypothetical protein
MVIKKEEKGLRRPGAFYTRELEMAARSWAMIMVGEGNGNGGAKLRSHTYYIGGWLYHIVFDEVMYHPSWVFDHSSSPRASLKAALGG